MSSTETRGLSLRGDGLRRRFRRFELEVPEIDVPAGTVTALLGPSGSGKSTLLGILGLLERPDAGRVLVGGREADLRATTVRRSMAAVFQRAYLFKGSVGENVAYGLKLRGVPSAERGARIAEALGRVGLAGWAARPVSGLSGGEAQRVALARALVLEPRILLLDEPLGSLDPLLKARLAAEFARILREEGTTVLYVTHDQDEALVVADRVGIMRGGRLVRLGEAEDVMGLPHDAWAAEFVGMEEPVRGIVAALAEGITRVDCGSVSLFSSTPMPEGEDVLVGVRPEDVLIFEPDLPLPASTARNVLPGVVAEVRSAGSVVRVVIEDGPVRLAASVSKASVRELSLAPGVRVRAVFKATATRLGAMPAGQAKARGEEPGPIQ